MFWHTGTTGAVNLTHPSQFLFFRRWRNPNDLHVCSMCGQMCVYAHGTGPGTGAGLRHGDSQNNRRRQIHASDVSVPRDRITIARRLYRILWGDAVSSSACGNLSTHLQFAGHVECLVKLRDQERAQEGGVLALHQTRLRNKQVYNMDNVQYRSSQGMIAGQAVQMKTNSSMQMFYS